MGVLDLSGADTSGFEAMPSGRYRCSIFSAEMVETKGSEGSKLPAGTPMIKVQWQVHFNVTDPENAEYENRRLFSNYSIPEKDYENAAKLQGMLVRFLVAIGYEESEVTGKKFNLDVEDLVGREADVTVGQKPDYHDPETMTNDVKGVRPAGSSAPSSAGIL
jgi:hypothetical protein